MAARDDKTRRAPKAEREWRERLILTARKMQLASQSFTEDLASFRDVRPGMDRLEQALIASREKLDGLEDRLLNEILRRLEEKSGHAAATDAQRELDQTRDELRSREEELERLGMEQDELSSLRAAMENLQKEHEAAMVELKAAGDVELAALRDRLRTAELRQSEVEAGHQSEMRELADHMQSRVRKLEDEIQKKRRGIKALTEENIQLQIQLGSARKELEERIVEIRELETQLTGLEAGSEDDTRAAIEAQTTAELGGEPPGALPLEDEDLLALPQDDPLAGECFDEEGPGRA